MLVFVIRIRIRIRIRIDWVMMLSLLWQVVFLLL